MQTVRKRFWRENVAFVNFNIMRCQRSGLISLYFSTSTFNLFFFLSFFCFSSLDVRICRGANESHVERDGGVLLALGLPQIIPQTVIQRRMSKKHNRKKRVCVWGGGGGGGCTSSSILFSHSCHIGDGVPLENSCSRESAFLISCSSVLRWVSVDGMRRDLSGLLNVRKGRGSKEIISGFL